MGSPPAILVTEAISEDLEATKLETSLETTLEAIKEATLSTALETSKLMELATEDTGQAVKGEVGMHNSVDG